MKRFKVQKAYLVCMFILSIFIILSGCELVHRDPLNPPIQLLFIEVTPSSQSIAKGTIQQFVATGIYADNSKQDLTSNVIWTSSNEAIGTISNLEGSNGVATGIGIGGPITITATFPDTNLSGTAQLTVTAATLVSIGVTPVNRSIALGTNQQFIATGIFSDLTTQNLTSSVTWTSFNAAVASISNVAGLNGLVTSSTGGVTTIAATLGSVSGSTTLTVTTATLDSIAVTPVNPSIANGTTRQFTAIGTFNNGLTQDLTTTVTWSSSDAAVASISNAVGLNGLATGLGVGSPIITATFGSISGSTTLTVTAATLVSIGVTPINRSIVLGTNQQFIATGIFSDLSTQNLTSSVTWTSFNSTVASISNAAGANGLATSLTVGVTTMTATFGSVSGSTSLTVTAATLVSIAVTPINPSIANGTTRQFTAIGTFSNGLTQDLTTTVTWTTTPIVSPIATISNADGSKGLATGLSVGSTPITATLGLISGSTTLTVTAATLVSIVVTPVNPSIANGTNQQFIATGIFSNSTTQNLTSSVIWTSSDATVASISNAADSNGLATSLTVGVTTMTATFGSVFGSTTLTVTAATLDSIAVTPVNPSIANGTTQQFTAIGTFSDLTTQNLTSFVTWTTTPIVSPIATVSNADGSRGLATGLSMGSTLITATLGLISGSTTLTVTAATLVSIAVTPATASIPAGSTQQFIATGTYTSGPTQDLTSSVTWTSSNTAVATISNVPGSNGLATGLSVGGSTMTATVPLTSKTDDALLTVTAAPPTPPTCSGSGLLPLGTATSFAVLAGTALTITNPTPVIGDVGSPSITPASGPSPLDGNLYDSGSLALIATAVTDMQIAVGCATSRNCDFNYGGATDFAAVAALEPLEPGLHCVTGAMSVGSNLTLSTPGVYIFRSTGALTTTSAIILAFGGTANATNTSVFWVPSGATTIGATNTFLGTIMSSGGPITLSAATRLLPGRVLSGSAVTLATNTISKPTP